jgi:hypothetical protein
MPQADLSFGPSDHGAALPLANEQEPICLLIQNAVNHKETLAMKVVARRVYPLLAVLILFAVSLLSAQSPVGGVADIVPAMATEPVADPSAVVRAGHARFTVLS